MSTQLHTAIVRRFSAALLSLVLTAMASAQEIMPAMLLGEWQVTGSPASVGTNGSIVIPARTELNRTFASGPVAVRLISRPFFTASVDSLASLNVGPASVTFLRDQAGGALVLLGDQALPLPFTIALGADSRSAELLDFTLRFDPTRQEATLELNDRSFAQPATGTGPILVTISAGAQSDWQLDRVELAASTSAASIAQPSPSSSANSKQIAAVSKPSPAEVQAATALRKQAFEKAIALVQSKDRAKAEEALLSVNRNKPGTLAWHIESAGRLTHLALSLRQRYDYHGAIEVAQRALAILKDAEKLTPTATTRQQASVHEMAGFLKEEILRDPAAARGDYEKASQFDGRSVRAREALQRLDEAKAKSQRLAGDR